MRNLAARKQQLKLYIIIKSGPQEWKMFMHELLLLTFYDAPFSQPFYGNFEEITWRLILLTDRFECRTGFEGTKKLNDSSATRSMLGAFLVWQQCSPTWWTPTTLYLQSSSQTLVTRHAGSVRNKSFCHDNSASFISLLSLTENSSPGHIIFFLVPVGLQISVNSGLFAITAIHCNRVKSEIHRMQMNDSVEQKKRRYIADKAMWVNFQWRWSWLIIVFNKKWSNRFHCNNFNPINDNICFFFQLDF